MLPRAESTSAANSFRGRSAASCAANKPLRTALPEVWPFQSEICPRRVANEVRKVLQAAVSNAENNHGLDVDRLYVSEATVGKTMKMRRFHARGRGRSAPVEKSFSRLTVVVRQKDE